MIERPQVPTGPWLICGLARSGQSAARLLSSRGEVVVAVDSASPEGAGKLAGMGVDVHLDTGGEEFVQAAAVILKSPGVPSHAPPVVAARDLGLPIVGELELGWCLTDGPVTAVTGTNGKTTVTEMIGHLIRTAGLECAVVGNVGRPVCELAGTAEASGRIVIEASSFQLEDAASFAPDVAVLLNLGVDHVDRHGSVSAYHEAKLSMLDRQPSSAIAVVPAIPGPWSDRGAAEKVTFGPGDADLSTEGGVMRWRGQEFARTDDIRLPGVHNLRNAEAACAAAIANGVPIEALADGLRSFEGVPHRLELVLESNGVRWYNDSKATNVGSALTALDSVEGPIHLILGGQGKGQDFTELVSAVDARCQSVHLIGESAGLLLETLARSGVAAEIDGDLAAATEACSRGAREGDAILLSPACASFDQFEDFEHRGAEFRRLVKELA